MDTSLMIASPRVWFVYLRLDHDINWKSNVFPALAELLLELEKAGWLERRPLLDLMPTHPELYARLHDLGIARVINIPPARQLPPGYRPMPDFTNYIASERDQLPAPADIRRLPHFLTYWTASKEGEKLRRQLERHIDAAERHAFLILSFEHPFAVALDTPGDLLPEDDPTLEEMIDGVWVTTSTNGAESRLLAWLTVADQQPGGRWIEGARPTMGLVTRLPRDEEGPTPAR